MQTQMLQNAVEQARQGRDMPQGSTAQLHSGESDLRSGEGFQQSACCRGICRPIWLPLVESDQGLLRSGQTVAHLGFDQRQQSQRQTQQPCQPDDLVMLTHIQGTDTKRSVLDQGEVPLQAPAPTVVDHCLGQRQALHRHVRYLDPPTQSVPLLGDRFFIPRHARHDVAYLDLGPLWPLRAAPPSSHVPSDSFLLPLPGHVQQASHSIPRYNLRYHRLERAFIAILPLAPTWFWCEGPQRRLSLGQSLLQLRGLSSGEVAGAYHLDPLGPVHCLTVDLGTQLPLKLVASAAGPLQSPKSAVATATVQPQTRSFVITTMPIAVHEMQDSMDYLKKDFAPGGLLDGKEVYGFYPSTLVVYQGDTVDLSLVNPQDDSHTFTITDLGINVEMKGQSTTKTSFVASKPGIYTFVCAEAEHMPYMWGQLVVLPNDLPH